MAHRFGLFDADCRELDESGSGLVYRPRVLPIVPKLEQLYSVADSKQYPLVFTTCCSGRMLQPAGLSGVCYVPLSDKEPSWRAELSKCRRFYAAKHTCGNPARNFACQAFDMFQYNANLRALLQELEVQTWVLFGNGFELCVGSAARGILEAGLGLILLEDVRISSVVSTPDSERATLGKLGKQGAKIMTLQSFLDLERNP